MTKLAPMTADELLHLNLPNKRTELVRGQLVVREPAGFHHGEVAAQLLIHIGSYVHAHKLGIVLTAETGFTLFTNPDTVRAPDVAFVSRARVPDPLPNGYAGFAPDLAVEVRSPGDRTSEIAKKVADWLAAGTKLVWDVDPRARAARVHRANGTILAVDHEGTLDGEDVLPGFSLDLAVVFS